MHSDFDEAVTLARFMFDRAESAIDEMHTYSLGLGVSLAQDAIETLLFVIARKLDASVSGNIPFDRLWKAINKVAQEELPMSVSMARLNKVRVNYKHHAAFPEERSARRLVASAGDFAARACETYLAIHWEEISLAHAISDPEIRQYVKAAEQALSDGQIDECQTSCALAFADITTAMDRHLPQMPPSPHYTTGMELTRFRGHLILWEGGVHNAKIKSTLCAGVPAANDRPGTLRSQPGIVVSRV